MALYKLTGVDDLDNLGRKKSKEKKKKRKEKQAKRRENRKTKTKKILKVGAAPARAAFLLLVNANFLKLATKLAEGWKKDKNKVVNFWLKAGGKSDKLKEAIIKGSKQKLSGLGSVSLAAALATATPIMILATQLIRELRLTTPQEDSELDKAIDQGKNDLEKDPSIVKSYADFPDDGGSNEVLPIDKKAKDDKTPDEPDEEKDNTMLYLGLGVAAYVFLKN